jgi:hypothetical protein
MDKNSQSYMKSSFETRVYGDDNHTTFERDFKINGRDKEEVRTAAPWVEKDVMP